MTIKRYIIALLIACALCGCGSKEPSGEPKPATKRVIAVQLPGGEVIYGEGTLNVYRGWASAKIEGVTYRTGVDNVWMIEVVDGDVMILPEGEVPG